MADTSILEANLDLTLHSQAVLDLLNTYSQDPMGDGKPLSPDVLKNVIPGLKQHPTTLILLAFHGDKAVGIVTCFIGFSTFQARPLINISDFFIQSEFRGLKIGAKLLGAVEKKAMAMQCCKITLEVQENNFHAMKIYETAGFSRDIHVLEAGPAVFLSKSLPRADPKEK